MMHSLSYSKQQFKTKRFEMCSHVKFPEKSELHFLSVFVSMILKCIQAS